MKNTAAIILAAGEGKRMHSPAPKVLCRILEKPMLAWVLDSVLAAGILPADICVVSSEEGEALLRPLLPEGAQLAIQRERLGTGHAVMAAGEFIAAHAESDILVCCGDAALVAPATFAAALEEHRSEGAAVTVITAELADATGYGRVCRDSGGRLRIVEHKDCLRDHPELLPVREINSGSYWFAGGALAELLPLLTNNNAAGEYYLTDTLALAQRLDHKAAAYRCEDAPSLAGANDQLQLAALNALARERVLRALRLSGVEIPFDEGVIIGPDVRLAPGTRVLPGTILLGRCVFGTGCELRGGRLINVTAGEGCVLTLCQMEDCSIGAACDFYGVYGKDAAVADRVHLGPYMQLRPGTTIASGVKIGNFVEIKNSHIGENSAVSHLTYIGDSDMGENVNVGCGVVTVNYDGRKKYRCTIGDNAFVGCNCNLVAPVTLGEGSYLAAGSTITDNVPDGALAIARARQVNKPGYSVDRAMYAKRKVKAK